jgi:hypothetical protein
MSRKDQYRRSSQQAQDEPLVPLGDYAADGSWIFDRPTPERTHPDLSLYWFVDMLVTKRRRDPGCEPWQFAQRIARSNFSAAFPSAVSIDTNDKSRWTATIKAGNHPPYAIPFFICSARTSAEAAVVHAGYGAEKDMLVQVAAAEVAARKDLPNDPDLIQILLRGNSLQTEVADETMVSG